jgi:hypothetical protein
VHPFGLLLQVREPRTSRATSLVGEEELVTALLMAVLDYLLRTGCMRKTFSGSQFSLFILTKSQQVRGVIANLTSECSLGFEDLLSSSELVDWPNSVMRGSGELEVETIPRTERPYYLYPWSSVFDTGNRRYLRNHVHA